MVYSVAVGDIIVDISAANSTLDFQPAAGVEVMITLMALDNTGTMPQMYDGTGDPQINCTVATTSHDYANCKFGITNGHYLRIGALGAGNYSGYSGIQTA